VTTRARRVKTRAALLALAGALAGLSLSGCGAGDGAPSATTTSTLPRTTTTTPAATGTTATTAADFASAKSQWEQGANAISADQGTFLDQAATDLSDAIAAGGSTPGYQTAVQELQQLASLPETDDTAAQMSEAKNDITALNVFFGTSALYQ
jgi:pyruvate/2-oxoglutarate dehydrogenase complex dihydrolipoamide acyltransferase (E2) component